MKGDLLMFRIENFKYNYRVCNSDDNQQLISGGEIREMNKGNINVG